MSITLETAIEHVTKKAVTCCRFEAGGVIAPDNLEDPAIFPDLEDSGLLIFPEDALTIGEALGATVKETVDSLTVLTRDMVVLPDTPFFGAENEGSPAAAEEPAVKTSASAFAANPYAAEVTETDQNITITIGEGKDITLTFPL